MKFDSIGKNIRKYRLLKGLRQEDLAERANLSVNYIGMIERGEKMPSLESLINLVNALNVSTDMILCSVINNGYIIKESLLADKLAKLPLDERNKIYDVVDTMVKHAKKKGIYTSK